MGSLPLVLPGTPRLLFCLVPDVGIPSIYAASRSLEKQRAGGNANESWPLQETFSRFDCRLIRSTNTQRSGKLHSTNTWWVSRKSELESPAMHWTMTCHHRGPAVLILILRKIRQYFSLLAQMSSSCDRVAVPLICPLLAWPQQSKSAIVFSLTWIKLER